MFCLEQRSRVGLPCHERNQKKRGCCRTFREIAPVHTGLERGGRETQEPEAVLISYSDFLVTRSAISPIFARSYAKDVGGGNCTNHHAGRWEQSGSLVGSGMGERKTEPFPFTMILQIKISNCIKKWNTKNDTKQNQQL